MKKLRLKHGQERRVLDGSLWIFSNQIDDSLHDYQPGEIVRITLRNGRFLGVGYVNPHSLIAARLLCSEDQEINADFFRRRLEAARHLRLKVLPGEEAVREVFSESDGLPGLIVDRYRDHLVVQISTAGMDRLKPLLLPVLQEIYQPQCIFERSDLSVRQLEGLEKQSGLLWGELADQPLWVKYAGLNLPVDVQQGQKTGLYLDQRRNLEIIAPLSAGARVLDLFSYTGAWGVRAAKHGATEVVLMDASEWALQQAVKAARRQRVSAVCQTLKGDAFDYLKRLAQENKTFEIVIIDPPSFIKSRAHFQEGRRGYYDLNQRALAGVAPGGFLITCSCSHHMEENTFLELLHSVLQRSGRRGKLIYRGYQGPDHPILPSMPETKYLHCLAYQLD